MRKVVGVFDAVKKSKTKRDETKRNETKRDETRRDETKREDDGMMTSSICVVASSVGLFEPFIYKSHHFTKTGSGQT
jgi:hypothetical protein